MSTKTKKIKRKIIFKIKLKPKEIHQFKTNKRPVPIYYMMRSDGHDKKKHFVTDG